MLLSDAIVDSPIRRAGQKKVVLIYSSVHDWGEVIYGNICQSQLWMPFVIVYELSVAVCDFGAVERQPGLGIDPGGVRRTEER